MSQLEMCWTVTSYVSVILQLVAAGVCLGILAAPYLPVKGAAVRTGFMYGAVMTVLYVMPPQIDNILAYAIGTLAAFAVMCAEDRRNVSQKIFLSVTFFSLRWLSASMARIFEHFSDMILICPEIVARPWLQYGLYAAARLLDILFGTGILLLAVLAINRSYESKGEDMGSRELLMLVVPSLSGVAGYVAYHFYQFRDELAEIYDLMCFFFYLISILAILVIIVLFQRWKTSREEQAGQELLESQIDNIKTHIEGVEKLYGDIRSLRHDMGDHIQMIECLVAAGNSAEASAYLARLKDEWREIAPEIRTGNPVTDMILLEKKKEAGTRGIRFECDFRYPDGAGLDAFDVSVLLYNALNNCLESVNGKDPYIRIHAFCKNSVFMLIISNSFSGKLRIDPGDGLPRTVKQGAEHGIGLKNMRRVARKYMGDLSFEQKGDEVTVGIMLQIG